MEPRGKRGKSQQTTADVMSKQVAESCSKPSRAGFPFSGTAKEAARVFLKMPAVSHYHTKDIIRFYMQRRKKPRQVTGGPASLWWIGYDLGLCSVSLWRPLRSVKRFLRLFPGRCSLPVYTSCSLTLAVTEATLLLHPWHFLFFLLFFLYIYFFLVERGKANKPVPERPRLFIHSSPPTHTHTHTKAETGSHFPPPSLLGRLRNGF